MRVLVTGLGTFWGSRLAQALEQLDDVEVIVGLDTEEPRLPLERTEFVRADSDYSILQRIVKATKVDTILHTHLLVDSTEHGGRRMHEVNVIGTMNLLAAAGAAGSTVRKLIVKASTLIYGAGKRDPYFFREDMDRTTPPRTEVERSLLETSAFVRDVAVDNPHVIVTKLRFCNVLGDDISSPFSRALRLPIVPEIAGFDPRLQFVHEDDITRALVFATQNDVPGVFNVAGRGTMPWSEVCRVVGKRRVPLPPMLTNWAVEPLRIARVIDLPPEVLNLLRYGRVVDTRAFRRAGFEYQYTTAATVNAFARSLRLQGVIGDNNPSYRYQRDVETFFRHSPAVHREGS
jgi:UDP-glucose 4-epimerase